MRTAIGWIGEHAADYGLDAGRVFLWGDSAGGHLALLAALTGAAVPGPGVPGPGVPGPGVPGPGVPGPGVPGPGVRGVVAWFPVTDLTGLPSDVASAGGVPDPGPESREALLLGVPASSVPDLAREASPVSHASAAAPPVLLMHGAADDLVPPAQTPNHGRCDRCDHCGT